MADDGITPLGDYARLDTDRAARTGDPEVVYGGGKSPQQVVDILAERLNVEDVSCRALCTCSRRTVRTEEGSAC